MQYLMVFIGNMLLFRNIGLCLHLYESNGNKLAGFPSLIIGSTVVILNISIYLRL